MNNLDSMTLPVKDFEENYYTRSKYLFMRDPESTGTETEAYFVHAPGLDGEIAKVSVNDDGASYTVYPNHMNYGENGPWTYVWSAKVKVTDLVKELDEIVKQHKIFWEYMGGNYRRVNELGTR